MENYDDGESAGEDSLRGRAYELIAICCGIYLIRLALGRDRGQLISILPHQRRRVGYPGRYVPILKNCDYGTFLS